MSKPSPFGTWKSPITADLVASSSVRLGGIVLDGDDTYWLEGRPTEGGRMVLVHRDPAGVTRDVTPPPYNVRTRVHEYGGGAYAVANGTAYFSNFKDQRLYRVRPGADPEPVTLEAALRYADFQIAPGASWMLCILEDHREAGREAANAIARLDLEDGSAELLVSGNDFYSSPRISPDGSRLAWLTWNHPNMPWDDVELWVGALSPEGQLSKPQKVAGGMGESVMQPLWSPDGRLYFVSDRSNWWNLYRWVGGEPQAVAAMEAEFGYPSWVFGMAAYGFDGPGRIIAAATRGSRWQLLDIDAGSGNWSALETPFDSISNLKTAPGRVVFSAGSPVKSSRIVELDLQTREIVTLQVSTDVAVDGGYLSTPRAIEFPTENGLTAFGFHYPPANKDFEAPAGEQPPLIVFSHGGPTGATSASFNLAIQYWTSRGFSVVDVNYGGSTGYGRDYRRRLYGKWGIVDVDDCVNAAAYLVKQGEVDAERLAIRGGSAGGYTTLAALTFRKVFQAGASYYGVGDLGALAEDTHKFESRYLDQMVGPYPERRDIYEARSPLYHIDDLATPVIFFQGLEDRVVPPRQAESMADALRKKGVPVAYLPFEGEQHGFRQAKNITRALEAEYFFYARIFGFEPADEIEEVPINNL